MDIAIRITKARADLLAFIRDNPCTSHEAMQEMGATHANHVVERTAWLFARGLIREVCRIRLGARGPYARMYEITPSGKAALTLSEGGMVDSPQSFAEVTEADLARVARRETATERV